MEDISIFTDKSIIPTDHEVRDKLGSTYKLWQKIHAQVMEKYPEGKPGWNYPGKKYGWSFRIKDKRRAILYLLPRDRYFKVAFVFGEKALGVIMQSQIAQEIKDELRLARKYAEGRGVSIDVRSGEVLEDIGRLIEIKLKH